MFKSNFDLEGCTWCKITACRYCPKNGHVWDRNLQRKKIIFRISDQIQGDQLPLIMPMVRKWLLFFGQNRVGMGNDLSVSKLMGVKKQHTVAQDAQHECQTKAAKGGKYFSQQAHFMDFSIQQGKYNKIDS